MKLRALRTVPALALMFGCAGEYSYSTPGTTYPTGADIYYDQPPTNIETYPYYDYRGQPLYDVNGRYWGRRDNRWYYYRERPRDLDERYRHEHYEHQERREHHDQYDHEHHD